MAKLFFKYRPPPGILGEAGPQDEPPPAAAATQSPTDPGENPDRWWHQSSYDLQRGLQVREESEDTGPGDLLDELFKR